MQSWLHRFTYYNSATWIDKIEANKIAGVRLSSGGDGEDSVLFGGDFENYILLRVIGHNGTFCNNPVFLQKSN